jgi:hypothetical protein
MSRIFYYEESVGTSTTTNSSDQTKVTLTFTPNANKKYAYIWSAQVSSSSTSADVRVNLKKDSTIVAEGNIEDADTTDWHPVSGVEVEEFGATPSSVTLTINWSASSSNTAGIRETRILVLEMTDNDVYVANTSDQTNTDTTFSTATTLNWTPSSAGDYVLLGSVEYRFNSTSGEVITQFVHSSTTYGEVIARAKDANNYYPMMHAIYLSSLSGSQTATVEWARSSRTTGTAYCRNAHLLALRVDDFYGAWENNNRARATTTSASPVTRVDTGATTVDTTAKILVIGAAVRDHNAFNNSALTVLSENNTNIISATIQEPPFSSSTVDVPAGLWCQIDVINPVANDASYQVRYYTEASNTSTGISDAQIVVLQLESSAASPDVSGYWYLNGLVTNII